MRPIYRLLYRLYRMVSGTRYWAARRFTPVGLAVMAGVLVAGASGLDPERTVAYQAFALLVSLIALAMCASLFFRGRFSIERALPRFATAGQPFTSRVTVRNLGTRPQIGLTVIEDLDDPRPTFTAFLANQLEEERRLRPFSFSRRRRQAFQRATVGVGELPPLPPGEAREASLRVVPKKRGVLRFKGVCLARPDPLGLFRAFVRVPGAASVLVLPRRYFVPPLALPGLMKYQQGGVALASSVGESEEFISVRDYRQGDPLRHIHWRSWARAGKPIVKEFQDEFFVRHALILDTFVSNPLSEAFEEAVSVAASFACTIPSQESLLDLLFVEARAYCFTAGRGLAHSDQMLEILASVQPCADKSFTTLEHLVLDHAAAVSGCICVLVAWDAPRRRLIQKLHALEIPLLVFVVTDSTEALDPGPLRATPERFRVLRPGEVEAGLQAL